MNPAPSFSPRSAAGAAGASVAAVSIQERGREIESPLSPLRRREKGGSLLHYRHPPSKEEEEVAYHLPVKRNEGLNEGIEGRWFRICRIEKRSQVAHTEFSDLEVLHLQEFF